MQASVEKSTQVVDEFIVTLKTPVAVESPTLTLQVVKKTEYHITTVKFTGYQAKEMANDFAEEINDVPPATVQENEAAPAGDAGPAPEDGESDNGSGIQAGIDGSGIPESSATTARTADLGTTSEVAGSDGRGPESAPEVSSSQVVPETHSDVPE